MVENAVGDHKSAEEALSTSNFSVGAQITISLNGNLVQMKPHTQGGVRTTMDDNKIKF